MTSIDPHRRIVEMVEGASPVADPCDDLGPSDASAAGADPKVVELCASLDHSDTDNGKRLREHFGRDLCVMAQSEVAGGAYLVWCGTHWDRPSGEARAQMLAQQLGGRIAQEAEYLAPTPDERAAIFPATVNCAARVGQPDLPGCWNSRVVRPRGCSSSRRAIRPNSCAGSANQMACSSDRWSVQGPCLH